MIRVPAQGTRVGGPQGAPSRDEAVPDAFYVVLGKCTKCQVDPLEQGGDCGLVQGPGKGVYFPMRGSCPVPDLKRAIGDHRQRSYEPLGALLPGNVPLWFS